MLDLKTIICAAFCFSTNRVCFKETAAPQLTRVWNTINSLQAPWNHYTCLHWENLLPKKRERKSVCLCQSDLKWHYMSASPTTVSKRQFPIVLQHARSTVGLVCLMALWACGHQWTVRPTLCVLSVTSSCCHVIFKSCRQVESWATQLPNRTHLNSVKLTDWHRKTYLTPVLLQYKWHFQMTFNLN